MEKRHLPPAFKGSRILFLALGHSWFIPFLLSSIASPSFTEVRLGDEVERLLVFVKKQRISSALLKLLWGIYYEDQYMDLDGNQTDLDPD